MTDLHVLRVFVGPDGRHGNPLGVLLDGSAVAVRDRQEMARQLNFSETVFVDEIDGGSARIQIYTPASPLAFAGHPTVGTSWLLRQKGHAIERLLVPAGTSAVWQDGELAWIRARAAWVHAITIQQYGSAAEVDALAGPPPGEGSFYPWAWLDEAGSVLRARYFAGTFGIAEDEATGAAAVLMGDRLRRAVTIRQGRGSELHVRPGADRTVEVGGRVTLDTVRSMAQ